MRKYPAYTWSLLKRESAVMFFTLLRHAYRFDAADAKEALQIALVGKRDEDEAQETLDYYSNASRDILDDIGELSDTADYSAIDRLKKVL